MSHKILKNSNYFIIPKEALKVYLFDCLDVPQTGNVLHLKVIIFIQAQEVYLLSISADRLFFSFRQQTFIRPPVLLQCVTLSGWLTVRWPGTHSACFSYLKWPTLTFLPAKWVCKKTANTWRSGTWFTSYEGEKVISLFCSDIWSPHFRAAYLRKVSRATNSIGVELSGIWRNVVLHSLHCQHPCEHYA